MNVRTYYRFSNREQSEGTSIKRQSDDCKSFATRKGWTIIEEMVDAGKSAFSGANRETGAALGQYEIDVRMGLRIGETLLVERLDRVSRQGYDETQEFVKLLTSHGVSVATVDGDEFYAAGQRLDMMQVIKMLLKAEVAHEESVKKSQRLKRRYEIRRDEAKANGTAMTRMMPAWLRVGKDKRAEIIQGRDAVIRRIFELADSGVGSLTIARKITAEFEPWTALDGRKAGQWNRSRISRILSDRQVTGEFQPMLLTNGERIPAGEPWPDHFPRIIAQDVFERVNAAAASRQSPAGRRSTVVANLFAGLLRCETCGGPMFFERKRPAGTPYHGGKAIVKHDESLVRCSNAFQGGRCTNRATVSYYGFEKAMLDACMHLALDDRLFVNAEELTRLRHRIAEQRRAHELAVSSARAMWAAYRETESKMAMTEAAEAERSAEALLTEIDELEKLARDAAGKADAEAHLSRVADFRQHMYADDLDVRKIHRTKVATGFRSIIKRIEFTPDRSAVVEMIGDLRLIVIRRGKVLFNADLDKRSRDATKGLEAGAAALVRQYQARNRAA